MDLEKKTQQYNFFQVFVEDTDGAKRFIGPGLIAELILGGCAPSGVYNFKHKPIHAPNQNFSGRVQYISYLSSDASNPLLRSTPQQFVGEFERSRSLIREVQESIRMR